ncbi:NTP transferase domain-containing protein [Sulfuracidifex metallicus]|uniref:NTP transferase domain-containing protein n=1 Tax=Sulfuracidifex metallicus DSM 6482 = JCM 9184 TaxID=523847 RepID=A0A6A9QJH4_SULME|nr:NTP transferase domain-containing protein [Sulfuracidifex metallicus]MUN28814.1 NTP transferase domain-containing protein [Sulfuracidifex metallicus DSM 6482 = JCM 9184]WOE50672.1 NTP transferase domain-containing protein [Sulfuracidifex metallicus DSM 6482 = JCM 9184]
MRLVIMAGGKGSRLSIIKPILTVCGKPILQRMVESLSPHYELWVATVRCHPVDRFVKYYLGINNVLYTDGLGYENDVVKVVRKLGFPLIVVPSDIPFITNDALKVLIRECKSSLCSLKDISNSFTGISLWRNEGYFSSFQDVFLDYSLINVNDWNTFLQANKSC